MSNKYDSRGQKCIFYDSNTKVTCRMLGRHSNYAESMSVCQSQFATFHKQNYIKWGLTVFYSSNPYKNVKQSSINKYTRHTKIIQKVQKGTKLFL